MAARPPAALMLEYFKIRLHQLLRWSEAYTKTDMVYLARGGSWMITGQVLAGVTAFALAAAFANLIPREDYGNYKYILSLGSIIGALTLSGLGTFVTQSVGRGLEGALRYSFKLSLLSSAPLVLVALGASGYYALHGNLMLSFSLIAIAVATPLLNSAQLYTSFLGGKRDFRLASILNAGTSVFQAALLALVLFLHASVLTLVVTYFSANTLATLACYWLTLRLYRPNDELNKEMAHFSVRLSLANVAVSFVGQLDKVLIYHFVGAAPVAVYALAQAPVVQMRAALKLATPLALPKLTSLDRATIAKTLRDKMNRFTAAIFVMVVVYIALVPFLFRLVFPAYTDAIPYSQAYALVLLLFPKKLIGIALYAQEERRGQYVLAISTSLSQLILLVALVPFIGIWGAIIAEIGANLLTNSFANYYFERFRKEHE